MEEKGKMCVINTLGKRLNPVSSEEQVFKPVDDGVKILIKSVEIEESTTVDKDVHFGHRWKWNF